MYACIYLFFVKSTYSHESDCVEQIWRQVPQNGCLLIRSETRKHCRRYEFTQVAYIPIPISYPTALQSKHAASKRRR